MNATSLIQRTSLGGAIGTGFRKGARHWRWMLLVALSVLALGSMAAQPLIRHFVDSIGHNPLAATSDHGNWIQLIVEAGRSMADNEKNASQVIVAFAGTMLIAALLKLWFASGLVASVRSDRGLGFGELLRASMRGFWPILKLVLLFVPLLVVFALPVWGVSTWAQGARAAALDEAAGEMPRNVLTIVGLICTGILAVWFESARAALASLPDAHPRVRSAVGMGLRALLRRPFATFISFLLFFVLGLFVFAVFAMPQSGIGNGVVSSLVAGLGAMVVAGIQAMRLESMARVVAPA